VGLTGLIYAAIVIAWAAYLVPMALRRSRAQSRRNSVERFSSAMRVLSRKNGHIEGRMVVTPPRPVSANVAARPVALDIAPLRRRHRAAARLAAKRRRRVLFVLLLATIGVSVATAYAMAPTWTPAMPVTLMLAFLVVARVQVRKAERIFQRMLDRARPSSSDVLRRAASRVEATSGAVVQDDSADDELAPDDQPTRLMHLDLADQQVQEAVAIETTDGSNLWDPVTVTLPTYVSKPAAHRQVRTVNLSADDVTSSARNEKANERELTGAATRDADELTNTPRAVGE
jgi:hypothetical protein